MELNPPTAANERAERVTEALPPQPLNHSDEHDMTDHIDVGEWEDVLSGIKMCKSCA